MDNDVDDFFRPAVKLSLNESEALKCRNRLMQKMTANPVRGPESECLTEHMTDIDPSFVTSTRSVRLSDIESAKAETALHAFMKEHPIDMRAAIAATEEYSAWYNVRSFFSMRYGTVAAAVLVLVLGGGSLSYAAESALPGDPLYPIKVNVNEEVRAQLAVSTQAKAAWNTTRAERRVNEAEELAAKGRLTPENNSTLIAAFQIHVNDAEKNIHAVADSGDTDTAIALNTALETTLQTHASLTADNAKADNSEIALMLTNVNHVAQETAAFNDSLQVRIAMQQTNIALSQGMTFSDTSSKEDSSQNESASPVIALQNQVFGMMRKGSEDTSANGDDHSDAQMMMAPMMFALPKASSGGLKNDQKKNWQHSSSMSSGSGSSSVHSSSQTLSSVNTSTAASLSSTENTQTSSSTVTNTSSVAPSSANTTDPLPVTLPIPVPTPAAGLLP